jgi:hypothetical protein
MQGFLTAVDELGATCTGAAASYVLDSGRGKRARLRQGLHSPVQRRRLVVPAATWDVEVI